MDLPFARLDAPAGAIAETARLRIRPIALGDAAFLLRQLNEPSWLRYIGDKQVRTVADAENYVRTGPLEMVRRHGFGINVIELKSGAACVGVCGLVKRDALPHPDLGFALLEEHWGKGYALEAARAVMLDARTRLGIGRMLAITTQANERSGKLLLKLGFAPQGTVRLSPDAEELKLYAA